MFELNLNMYHATAIAALVLLLGRWIIKRSPPSTTTAFLRPLWAAWCTLWFTWPCTLPVC